MTALFPAPACAVCNDTGEVCTYYRGGEEPEFAPCECPTGLLLAAFITEKLTQFWATVPLTKQENNRG